MTSVHDATPSLTRLLYASNPRNIRDPLLKVKALRRYIACQILVGGTWPPWAGRSTSGRKRGPDLRDADAAAPARDGVPADHRGPADAAYPPSAFRAVLDSWLFTLQSEALAANPGLAERGQSAISDAVSRLLEQRLAVVSRQTPAFAQGLRAYHAATAAGDAATADALAAWLGG